ncbi:MAG: diguanylate cyclase [Isosphaeraceae bacterium]
MNRHIVQDKSDAEADLLAVLTAVDRISNGRALAGTAAPLASELTEFLAALHGTIRTVERNYEQQRRLREVTTLANAGLWLDDIMAHVYEAFRPLIPYDRIGLALLEDDGRALRARWARSNARVVRLKVGYAAAMEGSSLRGVLQSGQPRVLSDLTDYLAAHPGSAPTRLMVEEGMRSSLTCPLTAMGKPVGFLFFSSRVSGTYAHAHVETFLQISEQISVIVEKARMYEELQESHRRLEAEVFERMRTEARLRQAQVDLESANRELALLASTDGMTGVSNRRAFDEFLTREWRRGLRNVSPVALVLVDVDQFKAYNDAFGHLAGDDVLRAVAREMAATVRRPCDLVARFGGEEFAVLLPETDRAGALLIAERIRMAVEALQVPHGASRGVLADRERPAALGRPQTGRRHHRPPRRRPRSSTARSPRAGTACVRGAAEERPVEAPSALDRPSGLPNRPGVGRLW